MLLVKLVFEQLRGDLVDGLELVKWESDAPRSCTQLEKEKKLNKLLWPISYC